MKKEEIKYPIRINHYLALHNYGSRRKADEFIRDGKVKINGRVAVLGDKVNENDKVAFDAKALKKAEESYVYLAYNKPIGIVTHSPERRRGQKSIQDVLNFSRPVFPLGRLDKESRGLIILTNDGRITKGLLDPEYAHEKEYIVKVNKLLTPQFLKSMHGGVQIENYMTKKCRVEQLGERTFRIILTEGKKHQIRLMCQALEYHVIDLCRIRIMHILLGTLEPGKFRKLEGEELKKFLKDLAV